MIIDKINKDRIIEISKNDQYVMALKREGSTEYESFWEGDGHSFSILHGTCDVEEKDGYFYHHHDKEPKRIAKKEDCLIILEKDFWKLVDFSVLTDDKLYDYINSVYHRVRDDEYELELAIQQSAEAICCLLHDLVERNVLSKRRYLYKTA